MASIVLFKLLLPLLLFLLRPLASDAAAPAARNTRNLAHTALTVSAKRAREASAYVSRLSSGNGKSPHVDGPSAFQDCMGMMAHSADRLQLSVGEMSRLGRKGSPKYALRLSNVQTWVSSALTDQDMCLGSLQSSAGVSGESDRNAQAVRRKVESARKYTSNALSLVNKMN